jgi:hypothetical protein
MRERKPVGRVRREPALTQIEGSVVGCAWELEARSSNVTITSYLMLDAREAAVLPECAVCVEETGAQDAGGGLQNCLLSVLRALLLTKLAPAGGR